MKIYVSSLADAPGVIADSAPSHVVTLLDPDEIAAAPVFEPVERHLRLAMHDIAQPRDGETAPGEAHVRALIAFGQAWPGERPLLIHCWAGVSRSTAAALTLACARNPDTPEQMIAEALRQAAHWACPNARIIALADAALGRDGRLSAAARAIGEGRDHHEARAFHIPAVFAVET